MLSAALLFGLVWFVVATPLLRWLCRWDWPVAAVAGSYVGAVSVVSWVLVHVTEEGGT